MKKYWLVTDSHAEEVEQKTGLRGRNTPFGVLIEEPPPLPDWSELRRALEPLSRSRCICGKSAIIHRSNCPEAQYGIT